MLRAYLHGCPEVCLCCIGTKVCLEVTRPPGCKGLISLGFYALRLLGLGLEELRDTGPAGVPRKIFISLHSLKPLGFLHLKGSSKGNHPLRSLDLKLPPASPPCGSQCHGRVSGLSLLSTAVAPSVQPEDSLSISTCPLSHVILSSPDAWLI